MVLNWVFNFFPFADMNYKQQIAFFYRRLKYILSNEPPKCFKNVNKDNLLIFFFIFLDKNLQNEMNWDRYAYIMLKQLVNYNFRVEK